MRFLSLILFCLFLCQTSFAIPTEDQKLASVLDEYTTGYIQLDPYQSIFVSGEEKYLGQFGDYLSSQYMQNRHGFYAKVKADLQKVDIQKLSLPRQQTYKLLDQTISAVIAVDRYPWQYLEFNQMNDRLRDFIDEANINGYSYFPFDSFDHYEAFISRANGLKNFVDTYIQVHREGLQKGIVQNCTIAKEALDGIRAGADEDIEKSPFWSPMTKLPASLTASQKQKLTQDFKTMILQKIAPEYQRFITFYESEYLPRCRKTYGLTALPNSGPWYDAYIYQETSTHMTAKEIHSTGLQEVNRIIGEIEQIKNQLGFIGTTRDFLSSLRNDKSNYFTSRGDMIARYTATLDKIKPLLNRYFSTFPTIPLKIVEDRNPNQPAARYAVPSDYYQVGRFLINTASLDKSQISDMITTSLHEGIPGHHFQLAQAYEMKDHLTNFERNFFNSNAFVEGWALYCEHLGYEMGLYEDPMQKLGNLNEDLLRAVRLVVDTGVHHFGWSRKKVLAYMSKYSASSPFQIATEADRYAAWPGQALGYKVGQLKILTLRHQAEKTLGSKFDIKGFHEAVIGSGTVTLDVLSDNVNKWIETTLHQ